MDQEFGPHRTDVFKILMTNAYPQGSLSPGLFILKSFIVVKPSQLISSSLIIIKRHGRHLDAVDDLGGFLSPGLLCHHCTISMMMMMML